ncbi:hypothetical protein SK128_023552 [Halocaridina rubra]|uniref:Uncharacterized protein n=1 Tax=Halocaridina rubra TaxID=373956 RepID=A0AAN8WJK1_HALRR
MLGLILCKAATRKLLEKLRSEESGLHDDDSDDDDDDDDDSDDEDEDDDDELLKDMVQEKPLLESSVKKVDKGGRRMFGNMAGDLDTESLDSDTDLNLEGEGDSELEGSEAEFGGHHGGSVGGAGGGGIMGMANGGAKIKGPRMRPPAGPPPDNDDDF